VNFIVEASAFNKIIVFEYLEYKIKNNIFTDDEYGLYLDYLKYGYKAINLPGSNFHIFMRLVNEVKTIYEGGDDC
jgi:hypothetical protein